MSTEAEVITAWLACTGRTIRSLERDGAITPEQRARFIATFRHWATPPEQALALD